MRFYYLVTVKLPKNPEHNPREKKSGPCPVTGTYCTDITGEHHTIFVASRHPAEWVAEDATKRYGHVTRVESIQ